MGLVALASQNASAFTPAINNRVASSSMLQMSSTELSTTDRKLDAAIRAELNYKAGAAGTEFAKRYGHLAGSKIRTVGETFAEFTKILGDTINPLYKGMITDLVGTTHLIIVNARFKRDPIWSLGMIKALDLLLKNYPEPDVRVKIESALFKAAGQDEAEIRAEAAKAQSWVDGLTREQIESALSGEGSSELAQVIKNIQSEEFWMYSRYFGIGLLQIMETIGIATDKDEVYPIMEDWMANRVKKSHLTACADSDVYFRVREKLDMMETMMKEIEIREKKRMAERLEEKAEAALRAADREKQLEAEIEKEAAKNRERVASS